jgi:serine/threonine-protein kinase
LTGPAVELSQAEVESHLEQCPNCRQELERLAAAQQWWESAQSFLSDTPLPDDFTQTSHASTAAREAAPSPAMRDQIASWLPPGLLSRAADPEKIGRIGQYDVIDLIGRGGMGIVLKAFDVALNRYVALKVMASEYAHNASARRRFAREAQAAAAVVHDHVVPIYAVDAEGVIPYLVMAYIPGHSLQERIDQSGPLEVREILRIGMQTAAGLAAAHAQGLVHRDIKPANILLENGVERVRITDFGLARAMDEASQTQSGVLAGTPQYMAPEQAAGEAIDYRTDLFSLGSVMYAMCTGHSPFRAESTIAVLRRICDGAPRPLREVNNDIPQWLAEIIVKLLSKRPSDRFGSADEVARLLAERLAQVQQPPPRTHGARKKKVACVGAAIAAVAGAAFLLVQLPAKDEKDTRQPPYRASVSSTAKGHKPAVAVAQGARRAMPTYSAADDPIQAEIQALHRALSRLELSMAESDLLIFRPDPLRDLEHQLNLLERDLDVR